MSAGELMHKVKSRSWFIRPASKQVLTTSSWHKSPRKRVTPQDRSGSWNGVSPQQARAFVDTVGSITTVTMTMQRCHGFYPPFLFENGQPTDKHSRQYTCRLRGASGLGIRGERCAFRRKLAGKSRIFSGYFQRKDRRVPSHPPRPSLSFSIIRLSCHMDRLLFLTSIQSVKQSSELTTFEKEYASMILKLDETVGIILDELERLGIDDRTMIVFCSDNGHEVYYQVRRDGLPGGREDLDGEPF